MSLLYGREAVGTGTRAAPPARATSIPGRIRFPGVLTTIFLLSYNPTHSLFQIFW